MGNNKSKISSKSQTKSASKSGSSKNTNANATASTTQSTAASASATQSKVNNDNNTNEEKQSNGGVAKLRHKLSDANVVGTEIIEQGYVKIDHFEKIYRIDPKVDGAPNFRQCQGFYIFGGGQPTITAHKTLFKTFQQLGLSRVLWFNMRSEPVIYVNDMSYAPRDPKHPSENIHLPHDITIEDVNDLSDSLAAVVRKNAENNKNIFVYHQDTYALLPEDRIDQTKEEPLNEKDFNPPVKSLMDLYDSYLPEWLKTESKESEFSVHCERLPVNDERAPDGKDINRLVTLIMTHSDNKTALVYNCQMGKGRTTIGMIMCALIKKNMKEYYDNLDQTMSDALKNNNDSFINGIFWPTKKPEISAEAAKDDKSFKEDEGIKAIIEKDGQKYYDGNYTIILNLVNLLTDKYKLDGNAIKQEADDIIDRCQHLQNLRRCIFSTRLRFEYETEQAKKNGTDSSRADYWKKISLNFVERYFVIICFNAYVHDIVSNGGVEQLTKVQYSQWMNEKKDIADTIGSYTEGPLSKFNWD